MNTKYLVFYIALFLGVYSCSQTNKASSNSGSDEINYADLNLNTGRAIVQSVCITCHDPKNSRTDRIAPPLEMVKRNYLSISNSESEFINRVTSFVLYPTKEEAKLHKDVDQFGLMDPLGYSKQDVLSVALYLYRTELERPEWLDSEEELNNE